MEKYAVLIVRVISDQPRKSVGVLLNTPLRKVSIDEQDEPSNFKGATGCNYPIDLSRVA